MSMEIVYKFISMKIVGSLQFNSLVEMSWMQRNIEIFFCKVQIFANKWATQTLVNNINNILTQFSIVSWQRCAFFDTFNTASWIKIWHFTLAIPRYFLFVLYQPLYCSRHVIFHSQKLVFQYLGQKTSRIPWRKKWNSLLFSWL